MHPYTLLLAIACLVCAGCGGALYLQAPSKRVHQLAALLLVGCGYWALSQALLTMTFDYDVARRIFDVAVPGWAFIGPLMLHITMEMGSTRRREMVWLRNASYAVSVLMFPLCWWTDQVSTPGQRMSWGWTYEMGPGLQLFSMVSLVSIGAAGLCLHGAARELSDAERRQLPWIAWTVAAQLMLTTVSDLVLPSFGIAFPQLGTIGLALLGGLSLWFVNHFGYSVVTPGGFSQEILRLLPDGVAMLRPDGRIRAANEGLARLAAQPVERMDGMPVSELLTWSFDSADHDEVDCELRTAGGGRIPVAVSSEQLRDRQGHDLGHVVVVRDLREVADLRHRLVTSARLAAVGELAAGIAHEINNPMAFVRANLSQLESRWKDVRAELEQAGRADALRETLGDVDELLADSLEGVDRAVEIVRNVKGFAHPGNGGREPVDLHRIVEDALRLIAPQLRGRAEVEKNFGELPELQGVPQQLRQVFVNLLLNASQAISPGGHIRLSTRSENGRAVVVVADDGPGIAPEIIDRIFDPFFTTKPVGEGTGLGLGIAYQIVRSHGGAIKVESPPGQGATFRVELPGE
ncbi:MAG TPA: ATP-binding protein [Myxococcota bacterium]|nr:ATP-binding protein [Myxococcota bacterium]